MLAFSAFLGGEQRNVSFNVGSTGYSCMMPPTMKLNLRFHRLCENRKRSGYRCGARSLGAFHLLEFFTLIVAPAALHQEGVEHKSLLVVGLPSVLEAPLERCGVGRASQDYFLQLGILDPQESAHALICAGGFVIGGQFALGSQSHFIEHAAEENEAAHLFGRMSESRDFHRGGGLSLKLQQISHGVIACLRRKISRALSNAILVVRISPTAQKKSNHLKICVRAVTSARPVNGGPQRSVPMLSARFGSAPA